MLGLNGFSQPLLSPQEIKILHAMDEIFSEYPFYGHRKIYHELKNRKYDVGRDRVLEYMRVLGLETLYPKPKKTTIANKRHQHHPYLLHHLKRVLLKNNIRISRDSKGRAIDNIIIERFFRTLKYENIYLSDYSCVKEAKGGINAYINSVYNKKRLHESLGYKTPADIYGG